LKDDVIPGYDRNSCDPFRKDSAQHEVRWRGKATLPLPVLSKGAKLRFWSRDCRLFSFRVAGVGHTQDVSLI
jgi:hypothetical protein